MYEIAALGAGRDQRPHPVADCRGEGTEFGVGVQGGAPSVRPIPRIVHQSGKDEFPPTADRRARRVPHHRGTGGCGYPVKRGEQAGEGGGDGIGALDRCVLQELPVMTYRDGVGQSGRCSSHLPDLRYR